MMGSPGGGVEGVRETTTQRRRHLGRPLHQHGSGPAEVGASDNTQAEKVSLLPPPAPLPQSQVTSTEGEENLKEN